MTLIKVDERMVEQIKALRAKGKKQEEIAVEVGVSQGVVSRVLRQGGLGGKLVKLAR